MISHKDKDGVRRLSQEYGMPESDLRQMLAIESGVTAGDVNEIGPRSRRKRFFRVIFSIVTLGIASILRGR